MRLYLIYGLGTKPLARILFQKLDNDVLRIWTKDFIITKLNIFRQNVLKSGIFVTPLEWSFAKV